MFSSHSTRPPDSVVTYVRGDLPHTPQLSVTPGAVHVTGSGFQPCDPVRRRAFAGRRLTGFSPDWRERRVNRRRSMPFEARVVCALGHVFLSHAARTQEVDSMAYSRGNVHECDCTRMWLAD